MSMTYWGINGFGLCLDSVYGALNQKVVKEKIKELFKPDQTEGIDDVADILDADWFYGDPYSNFAEFLVEGYDEKKILSWEDDGNGRAFLLYQPPYPWQLKPEDPKTCDELISYMVKVLQNVFDLSHNEIASKLDFISDWGCG